MLPPMPSSVDAPDWSDLPPPTDDGAADHLTGLRIPVLPITGDRRPFGRSLGVDRPNRSLTRTRAPASLVPTIRRAGT